MARRLATEYVKARMQLTEAQLTRLLQSLVGQPIGWHVKVLENGSQEVVLEDGKGDEITFLFEKQGSRYVCATSCRLRHPILTQIMQKLMSTFRGEAIVNRVFAGFTITYFYEDGSVTKIVENKGDETRIVYEQKDTASKLQHVFVKKTVERQIGEIQHRINQLLDERNRTHDPDELTGIDGELQSMVQQLFMLEA
ncbi:non-ribosomal peptide synthetase module [Paenibacillus marinisediminis]